MNTPDRYTERYYPDINELQKDVEKLLEAGIIVLEAGKYTFKDFYVWKPEADRYAYEEKYSS